MPHVIAHAKRQLHQIIRAHSHLLCRGELASSKSLDIEAPVPSKHRTTPLTGFCKHLAQYNLLDLSFIFADRSSLSGWIIGLEQFQLSIGAEFLLHF